MLITNLGSLRAELGRYMFQQRFQPDYDTAIQNFENLANRRLRVRPMETSILLQTSPATGATPIPADYLLWRTVLWTATTPDLEVEYVHPAYLDSTTDTQTKIFTIEGNTFHARPIGDAGGTYQFHYYQKIPTINGNDNNTNWLLDAHSDLYLNGVLFELFLLGRNGEAGQAYKGLRDEKLAETIQLYALTTGAPSSSVRVSGEYF